MIGKKFIASSLIDKLLYAFLIVAFFATAVTAISTAKFSSKINSYVVSNVSNALIDFADGGDGVVVLSDWKPGDSKTVDFSVRNYNDNNEVNEIAILYYVRIKSSALLPLNFTLTKTTDGVTTQIPLTVTKEDETTFSIYSSTEMTLKHSLTQLDSYSLKIDWPEENNDADALEVGGEYIKIVLDWRQYVSV